MRLPLLFLVLGLASPALAQQPRYASEPQDLYFEDVYEVFSSIAFDTGYLPSPGDPITVRFHLTPTGGVVTAMEAESHLEWPDYIEHTVVGVPGSGFLAVDTEIEIEAEVGIDIFGLWSGTVSLWSEQVSLYKAETFDPLLLGDAASVVLSGSGWIDPIEYDITVFTGLDVVVGVAVYPELSAAVAGSRIDTANSEGLVSQTLDGQWTQLPAPTVATERQALSVQYVSELDSGLNLVVEPSVGLDTFIGSFQLLAFPIDVPLTNVLGERLFPPVDIEHPMPVIGPTPASLDAGEILLDGLSNVPVTITNLGLLPLEGTARIVGSDDFTVFPDQLYVAPGSTDGVMVSFAPLIEGERNVVLELATNDPVQPIVEIQIRGLGQTPELPDDGRDGPPDDADSTVNAEELDRGCGCASAPPPAGALGLGLGLLAVLRRRR